MGQIPLAQTIILRQYIKHPLAPYRQELWFGPLLALRSKETLRRHGKLPLSHPIWVGSLWGYHSSQQVTMQSLPPSSAFPLKGQKGSSLKAPPILMRETPSLRWQSFIRCHCHITSVQSLSCVQLFATAAHQASLSIANSRELTPGAHHHRVSDAIQPPHPLSSPSPPALNLFHHQGLFKWVSSMHQVAKVLEFQPQHQSFQWTSKTDLL